MSRVRALNHDGELTAELAAAGVKLVVVDFTATWCQPCVRMAPVFDSLSVKYPMAVFLKVDVDVCQETAAHHSVSAMPSFLFFKNQVRVDRMQGSDPVALEAKIKQYYDQGGKQSGVVGHMDLSTFLLKGQTSVLNQCDGHNPNNVIEDDATFLESDTDEQLIFSFAFSQRVKIHSIKIKSTENAPKTVKLFVNQPGNLDFADAEKVRAVQELVLTPEQAAEGKTVNLKYVNFQNVTTIDVFIEDNQTGAEVTRVNYIGFIGSPINATNMDDFKRVAGKKGESH